LVEDVKAHVLETFTAGTSLHLLVNPTIGGGPIVKFQIFSLWTVLFTHSLLDSLV